MNTDRLKSLMFATAKIVIETAEDRHNKKLFTKKRSYNESNIVDVEYTIVNDKKEKRMKNEQAVTTEKKKGVFGRMQDSINNKVTAVQKTSESFMLESLIDTVMPILRKMLPKAKQDLHTYMKAPGKEKIIIIKTDGEKDVSITVMLKDAIEVNLKNAEQYETEEQQIQAYKDAVQEIWSLDDVVEKLVTGKIETIVKQ